MATSDNVLTKLHDLLLYIIPQLAKFPRDQKFILADRIETRLLDVQEQCIRAYYSRDKKDHLREANLLLELVRHLVRLAHDMKYFSRHRYGVVSEKEGLTPVYYTDAGFTTVYKAGEGTAPFPNWAVNGYRLPAEAEWEKAARGTLVGNTYPWGNSITGADANYNGSGDPFDIGGTETTPVGFYDGGQIPSGSDRANGYGLYDMAGNVWEWCWDWYDGSYYASSPAIDPRGPASSPFGARVLRGGSWNNNATVLRCADRNVLNPVGESGGVGCRSARGL